MNPFTSESRDVTLSVNLEGFCTRLRAPTSLARLIRDVKPGHQGLGDFMLKSAFDCHLMDLIRAGRYRECQTTLAVHFGQLDHVPTPVTASAVNGHDRGR